MKRLPARHLLIGALYTGGTLFALNQLAKRNVGPFPKIARSIGLG